TSLVDALNEEGMNREGTLIHVMASKQFSKIKTLEDITKEEAQKAHYNLGQVNNAIFWAFPGTLPKPNEPLYEVFSNSVGSIEKLQRRLLDHYKFSVLE